MRVDEYISRDASQHSYEVTSSRYHQADRVKINRDEYYNSMYVTYMLAATNTLKDMIEHIRKNPNDPCGLVQGDLEILLKTTWNKMVDNPLGRKIARKVDLTDIIEQKNINHFVTPKMRLTYLDTDEKRLVDMGTQNEQAQN